MLEGQGKLERAHQMIRTVLDEFKGCWGENHPEFAHVMAKMANVELAMLSKEVRAYCLYGKEDTLIPYTRSNEDRS